MSIDEPIMRVTMRCWTRWTLLGRFGRTLKQLSRSGTGRTANQDPKGTAICAALTSPGTKRSVPPQPRGPSQQGK